MLRLGVMENNRIIEIVSNHLSNKKLIAEEELEKIVNNDINTDQKIEAIEMQLRKINELTQMGLLWVAYTTPPVKENK